MCFNVVDDDDDDDDDDDEEKEEDRSQDQEAHFVPACAVELHTDTSQELFWVEITGKVPDVNPAASICASLRSRNALA